MLLLRQPWGYEVILYCLGGTDIISEVLKRGRAEVERMPELEKDWAWNVATAEWGKKGLQVQKHSCPRELKGEEPNYLLKCPQGKPSC